MTGGSASYLRAGGMPPADDERLEIDDDGAWRLWRTMGGALVGGFAGTLSADRRRRLAAAITSVEDGRGSMPSQGPARPGRPRPDSAHEAITVGEARLDIGAGGDPDPVWAPIVRLLRRWTEGLAAPDGADAALQLQLSATGPVIVRHGDGRLRVWPATLRVDVYARDRDGIVVDRASRGPGPDDVAPRGEETTTGPDWTLPVELPKPIDPPADGTLECWVFLDIDGPDGPTRVRLVASREG